MKLCKDCKHYRKSVEYVGYSLCCSPQAHETSPSFLANGIGSYADIMRGRNEACGLEGKLFEFYEPKPKPTKTKKTLWFGKWEF